MTKTKMVWFFIEIYKLMNLIKKFAIVSVFLFASSLCYSQGVEEIFCKLVETETNYTVPYATIQFKSSGKGIVANVDGDFRIPYRYKAIKDTLIISCLGYETKIIEATSLKDKSVNTIYLNPKIEALGQVVVQGKKTSSSDLDAYTLVKKAIASITLNYPTKPYSSVGYYRDYQIVRGDYYNLNEAIIESYDAGFQTDIMMNAYNESAILSYKENKEFSRDSSLLIAYDGDSKYIKNTTLSGQGGNELGILNVHNPIRNFEHLSFSFVYVFKRKFLENHEFETLRKVYLNDDIIYEISFKAKSGLVGSGHKAIGKIFIAKDNFAIHKLEYRVLETNNVNPLFEVVIEYKPKGDFMYLNYITFNNRFIVSNKFVFDVQSIDFNVYEQAFYMKFNNKLDTTTVDRKDFRFKYQKRKLLVKKAEIVDQQTVKITIADWSLPETIDENTNMSEFDYRVKNIYDVANRRILKSPKIEAYQFREFFAQDVFENKIKPKNLKFIMKYKPLSEAEVNSLQSNDDYWMNTPLKNTNN
ncbi:carboxypeptidase-like regulatory domain-containing protein [uncultured Psychroserpens sp.]|uniref:carboxypeptidase-like regulatory domain-containing protein n=1 Tax=uncultured Psychroserpens sp. TaxID=255436 RepID=UPI00260C514F|nr:carboxypeptidase-like regulatory domain-containing protein [uncultured Psychroserpens sp.]